MNFDKNISKYPVKLLFCQTDYIIAKSAEIKDGEEDS